MNSSDAHSEWITQSGPACRYECSGAFERTGQWEGWRRLNATGFEPSCVVLKCLMRRLSVIYTNARQSWRPLLRQAGRSTNGKNPIPRVSSSRPLSAESVQHCSEDGWLTWAGYEPRESRSALLPKIFSIELSTAVTMFDLELWKQIEKIKNEPQSTELNNDKIRYPIREYNPIDEKKHKNSS